jgi:alpha-beta hydrolase superfamily lysophospholipase
MSGVPKPKLVHPIPVDGLELELCRFGPETGGRSVLLLHGASATRDTFLVPDGGLVRYLGERGHDVWTLDWRGSGRIVDRLLRCPPRGSRQDEYRCFTLDRVASADIPLALAAVRERNGGKSIAVVAHCFGSGACAVAIAQGNLASVHSVVLSTLGLFYEAPWDGWIKAEDFVLERILTHAPECRAIDPRRLAEWPRDMRQAYELYPRSWLPAGHAEADEILRRLTFMFGQPYPPEVLAPDIHGPRLSELFGAMHVGLYLHAGQMVRRGFAAPFDEPDVIDRKPTRAHAEGPKQPSDAWPPPKSYLDPAPFRDKRITLLTGTENRLWHRDSIDLMFEWLMNEARPSAAGARPVRHVLRGYAHQDLYWGRYAERDVYPIVADALA